MSQQKKERRILMFDDTQALMLNLFNNSGCKNRSPEILTDVGDKTPTDKVYSTREEGYIKDMDALFKIYPNCGDKQNISLQELLKVCPRKRQRKDAYVGLLNYIKKKYSKEFIII